jgi:ATP-dependent DNA helicase RecG
MSAIGLSKEKVKVMLTDLESGQTERTTSTTDTSKFAQAICTFSNDLSNTAKSGYLFIGVYNNGTLSGPKAGDRLLQSLGGLRSDRNFLSQPMMSMSVFSFAEGVHVGTGFQWSKLIC